MPAAAPNPYFKKVITSNHYREVVLADNPTSYWRLGESSGPTAVDDLGLADHTYIGTPIFSVDRLVIDEDDNDTAVDFNGAGHTTGANLGVISFPYTIEAWVSIPANAPSLPYIFGTHAQAGTYAGIYMQYADRILFLNYGAGIGLVSEGRKSWNTTTDVPIDTPTHIVAVATDINTVAIYFNGVSQPLATSGTGTSISYTGGVPTIGKNIANNAVADFTIDEVAVYDGIALTAEQILNHYNAGS